MLWLANPDTLSSPHPRREHNKQLNQIRTRAPRQSPSPLHISPSPPSILAPRSPPTLLSSLPEMVSLRCTTAHHSLLGSPTCLAGPRRRARPVVRAAVAVEAGAQAKVSLIRIGTRGR